MKNKTVSNLMPGEVLKRYKSAIQVVVIGPSTSGKSTLVYALVNHKIIGFIKIGIGDKSQTTIIPCNFVFDDRIKNDAHFAIKINRKVFASKLIHIEVLEKLAELYCHNSMDADETMEEMTENWFDEILEPESATYHLMKLKDKIKFGEFKKIIQSILNTIGEQEPSIQELVKERKKSLANQKVAISEIRKMVFEEVWEKLSSQVTENYYNWIDEIGVTVSNKLERLLEKKEFLEMSVESDEILPYGAAVLNTIFDPFEPYSLVVDDIILACRPRTELTGMTEEGIPLRFCLRDTMGLTQIGMDSSSIKNSLDIALNKSPDSILLLLSLEERDEVLIESCKAVSEKIGQANKLDVPVHVLFTKADRIIGNIVNKSEKETVKLRLKDYEDNIIPAIKLMENNIERYLDKISKQSYSWLSLRYSEENIDPIQMALRTKKDDRIKKFKPDGLYEEIDNIIKETQRRILPTGIKNPIFVTVEDSNKPAIDIIINGKIMSEILDSIQFALVKEPEVVNGYTIRTTYRIHGRSVVKYWGNLQLGLGYTTHAKIFGNFSINMKAMLNKQLTKFIPEMNTLYESGIVGTAGDNLSDQEVQHLVECLDSEGRFEEMAFYDINPALVERWSDRERNLQILHLVFREYFAKTAKYAMVIDKIAYNLSYNNSYIKNKLTKIYYAPISYDETMRELQQTFKDIFESNDFRNILVNEMEVAMTELVNKMFLSI